MWIGRQERTGVCELLGKALDVYTTTCFTSWTIALFGHAKRPAVWGFQKSMLSDDYASMDVSIPAGTREALEHALAAPAVQHPADPLSDELLTPAERRELAAAGVSPSLLFHKQAICGRLQEPRCT